MPLSEEALNAYDVVSQDAIVRSLADDTAGRLRQLFDMHLIPGFSTANVLGLIPSGVTELAGRGEDVVVSTAQEAITDAAKTPEVRSALEAIYEFLDMVVDTVCDTFDIHTNRRDMAAQFAKGIAEIETALAPIEGVDKKLLLNGIAKGMREATSSFTALQGEAMDAASGVVVDDVLGTRTSRAENAAASAAAATYREVYNNIVADLAKRPPYDEDGVRRMAHTAASQVAGVYLGEDGKLKPTLGADGKASGMYGYILEGVRQLEAQQPVTAVFRLAPSDEIARSAEQVASAPPSPPAPSPPAPAPKPAVKAL